jgi:hypothetical protein
VNEGAAGSTSGTDITIRAISTNDNGTTYIDKTIHISQRTYPLSGYLYLYTNDYIENETNEYKFNTYQKDSFNGDWYVKWELNGLDGYAEIDTFTDERCIVKKLQEPETFVYGSIKVSICRRYDDSITASKEIVTAVLNDSIAEVDPAVVSLLYQNGLCANELYITKNEAAAVSDGALSFQLSSMKSFYGFKYFTNYTIITTNMFNRTESLEGIHLPEGITEMVTNTFHKYPGTSTTGWREPYHIHISKNTSSIVHPRADYNAAGNSFYFTVDEENEHFVAEDGILYSRNGRLICYAIPNSKRDYRVPEWVTAIGAYAIMSNGMQLDNLYIHSNVTSFGEG